MGSNLCQKGQGGELFIGEVKGFVMRQHVKEGRAWILHGLRDAASVCALLLNVRK